MCVCVHRSQLQPRHAAACVNQAPATHRQRLVGHDDVQGHRHNGQQHVHHDQHGAPACLSGRAGDETHERRGGGGGAFVACARLHGETGDPPTTLPRRSAHAAPVVSTLCARRCRRGTACTPMWAAPPSYCLLRPLLPCGLSDCASTSSLYAIGACVWCVVAVLLSALSCRERTRRKSNSSGGLARRAAHTRTRARTTAAGETWRSQRGGTAPPPALPPCWLPWHVDASVPRVVLLRGRAPAWRRHCAPRWRRALSVSPQAVSIARVCCRCSRAWGTRAKVTMSWRQCETEWGCGGRQKNRKQSDA
jgi:hypothetical protein